MAPEKKDNVRADLKVSGDHKTSQETTLSEWEQFLLTRKPIIAPDGFIPNSVVRASLGYSKPRPPPPPKSVPDISNFKPQASSQPKDSGDVSSPGKRNSRAEVLTWVSSIAEKEKENANNKRVITHKHSSGSSSSSNSSGGCADGADSPATGDDETRHPNRSLSESRKPDSLQELCAGVSGQITANQGLTGTDSEGQSKGENSVGILHGGHDAALSSSPEVKAPEVTKTDGGSSLLPQITSAEAKTFVITQEQNTKTKKPKRPLRKQNGGREKIADLVTVQSDVPLKHTPQFRKSDVLGEVKQTAHGAGGVSSDSGLGNDLSDASSRGKGLPYLTPRAHTKGSHSKAHEAQRAGHSGDPPLSTPDQETVTRRTEERPLADRLGVTSGLPPIRAAASPRPRGSEMRAPGAEGKGGRWHSQQSFDDATWGLAALSPDQRFLADAGASAPRTSDLPNVPGLPVTARDQRSLLSSEFDLRPWPWGKLPLVTLTRLDVTPLSKGDATTSRTSRKKPLLTSLPDVAVGLQGRRSGPVARATPSDPNHCCPKHECECARLAKRGLHYFTSISRYLANKRLVHQLPRFGESGLRRKMAVAGC